MSVSKRAPRAPKWPLQLILRLYEVAVRQGSYVIEQVSEEEAASLAMSFRRFLRNDRANARLRDPRYTLVTMHQWQPYLHEPHLGSVEITYASSPQRTNNLAARLQRELDDILPPVDVSDLESPSHPPPAVETPFPSAEVVPLHPDELSLDQGQIDDYVSRLRRRIKTEESSE